jgi:hypothetical protein
MTTATEMQTITILSDVGFAFQPSATRIAVRRVVEELGGLVDGYCGDDLQLAMPVESEPLYAAMRKFGFTLIDEFYFPLGSDSPPQSLRHDGRYRGSKGFWRYATFKTA